MIERIGDYVVRLMQGGTVEIVLLIVLVVVALVLLLVAVWILWKLLVLLGKGLLWLSRRGVDAARGQSRARREARLAAPPLVATGWSSSTRIGLRRALAEARRLVESDALCLLVVSGEGVGDLYRSLGLTPPGAGTIGIAAGGPALLIDATKADSRTLRKVVNALPWRRPVDAVVALVGPGGIPGDSLARAASIARFAGMRVALHFVFPSSGQIAAWRVIEPHDRDGDAICSQLAADAARGWLSGGSREGLENLAVAQSRETPASLSRSLSAAPSSVVDIASLGFGGVGLRAAVAQTVERTRPASASSSAMWAGVTVLAAGAALAALVAVTGLDRASSLRATLDTASREAAVPWTAEGIDTIPSAARVRRMAGLGARLAKFSETSPLTPLAAFTPGYDSPRHLGAAFLEAYVLRPLAAAMDRRARERFTPSDDPRRWVEEAREVGEWLAAWEGLADDPREVDVRRLLVAAFGGDESAWSEGTDLALVRTGARPPAPSQGGLDVDGLIALARSGFVLTMQQWADKVYTNGPVATAARRASDRSASWREQHAALVDLRAALQDPSQQWLTAAEDRPDHGFELRVLGRAVTLALLGQANALEAKAAVSRIRIDARKAVPYFVLPQIGPLMVRTSRGGQASGGSSLSLSPEAAAWLAFLDRVANAGFAELPQDPPEPLAGLVTVDPGLVSETLRRLRTFDRFGADLPAGLPAAVAHDLLRELASELVLGVAADVERAQRPLAATGIPAERAERLARIAPALVDLAEVEGWLRDRHAVQEADRVFSVSVRVAEGVLMASTETLVEEDPLGLYVDPAADRNVLVRRFERGVVRLGRVHEQFAAPFLDAATEGGGWAALQWRNMARDIEAYRRGDPDSVLSGLEGMVRAYVEDPVAACERPRPAAAAGRDDYVAGSLLRFRAQIDGACVSSNLARSRDVYEDLLDYFDRNIAWLWPYANDERASEVPASTLADFVSRLHDARDDLTRFSDAVAAAALADSANFWLRGDDGGAIVRFRIRWRARPSEERLAENIIEIGIEGADLDADGNYTWRYGSPLNVRFRLAKNSSYRFARAVEPPRRELTITGGGNGGMLRAFAGLANGALSFEAELVDERNESHVLRVTARVTRPDGTPLTLPRFPELTLATASQSH